MSDAGHDDGAKQPPGYFDIQKRVIETRRKIVQTHHAEGQAVVVLPTEGGDWQDLIRDLAFESFNLGRASVLKP